MLMLTLTLILSAVKEGAGRADDKSCGVDSDNDDKGDYEEVEYLSVVVMAQPTDPSCAD